jgi:hypothetical protein
MCLWCAIWRVSCWLSAKTSLLFAVANVRWSVCSKILDSLRHTRCVLCKGRILRGDLFCFLTAHEDASVWTGARQFDSAWWCNENVQRNISGSNEPSYWIARCMNPGWRPVSPCFWKPTTRQLKKKIFLRSLLPHREVSLFCEGALPLSINFSVICSAKPIFFERIVPVPAPRRIRCWLLSPPHRKTEHVRWHFWACLGHLWRIQTEICPRRERKTLGPMREVALRCPDSRGPRCVIVREDFLQAWHGRHFVGSNEGLSLHTELVRSQPRCSGKKNRTAKHQIAFARNPGTQSKASREDDVSDPTYHGMP